MYPLRVGVSYDFRNPPDAGTKNPDFYAAIIEQVKWLDSIGAELVWFTEHHFIEDGYLPSWAPVAGAMASVTSNVRFNTDICLLPFNHPIRLAEDLAVLDNLSNGRVEIGLGLGYAPHEFRGFGIPRSRRVSLMEEGLDVLKLCFAGEPFSYDGKHYQFNDVVITPGYVQEGGPPLWIATMSEAGAERVARHDAHILPQGLRARAFDPWVEALHESGRSPDHYRKGIIRSVLVTDDLERDWRRVRTAERYRMQLYRRFFEESNEGFGEDGEPIPQTWIVGDVSDCVDQLEVFVRAFGITDLVTMAVPPGLPVDALNHSHEQLFKVVVPQLKARLNASTTISG